MTNKTNDKKTKTTNRKISYAGLESLLQKYGLKKSNLVPLAGVSTNVVVALSRGEPISMCAATQICELFHVNIGEIMSIEFDPENDQEFAFAAIKRYADTNAKNLIHVEREGDFAVVSDTSHESPRFVLKIPLQGNINCTKGLLEQISEIKYVINTFGG